MFLLIVVMAIGFIYFQQFATDLVWKKEANRLLTYSNYNAQLLGNFDSNEINETDLGKMFYSKNESVFVIKRTGDIVYSTNSRIDNEPKSFFNLLSKAKNSSVSVKDFKALLLVGADNGNLKINYNGADSIMCYSKINNNSNCYVITISSTKNVVKDANEIITKVRILVSLLIVGAALIGLFYYRSDKRFSKALKDLIYKDDLTGHISYARFLIKAEEILKDHKNKKVAIYYGDIKNFKYINDTYGYDVGDKLLLYITDIIKKSLGNDGIFARITADSFAVLREYDNREDFIEKIYAGLDKASEFSDLKKENYKVGVYVGVYCAEDFDNKVSMSEMLDRANMAQKSIKGSNEFHVAFYNEEIRERIIAEKEIEKKMETALANGEFVVFYQPKYEVKSGDIIGAEALVRWNSPERGLLLPGKFIPLFEQNGFIVNLDQYVFENVCKTVREWLDNGKKVVSISINVSRVQFYRLDFVKRYTKIKNKYEIPDGLLELEFTESIVLENIELLQKIVNNLKASGFVCSIDDFGSGYSSLNILKNLPMDVLKLDRLFFKNSDNTDRDKALIASVVTMARALKMKTVSEGIETWNQVNFLKEIGCDIIQGYVYSEPISRSRFEHLVEGKKRKVPEPVPEDKKPNIKNAAENNIEGTAKYVAALNYAQCTVIETDYQSDSYKILKVENIGEYEGFLTDGNNVAERLNELIERLVHPDDRNSLRERCLPIGVLSSFYQGEDKIITDFRMIVSKMVGYMWFRVTIVRVNTGVDSEFKSLAFIENIDERINPEKASLTTSKAIEDALNESCNMIYEINYSNDRFSLVHYNKELMGDRPESGEFSWLREQHLKKTIHPDDLVAFQNFISPQNVKNEFDSGKETLLTQARIFVNDEIKYSLMAITIVKSKSKDETDLKVIAFCQGIDEIVEGNEKTAELTEFVNNAVCEYYDIVYLVDLKTDETTVIQAHHAFSKLPRIIKYTKLVNKFVLNLTYQNDCERVKEFLDPNRITTALKLGKAGNACEFKRIEHVNGQEVLHAVRATYMKIPSTNDSKILFLVRDLGEIENPKSKKMDDHDSLNKLYKKETTEILIDNVLESIEPGETRAFVLVDISDVESKDNNNDWEYETRADVLQKLEEEISAMLSKSETLCRSGGYEFIIVSDKIKSGEELSDRLNELCTLLKNTIVVDGREYKVTGNVGVSIYGVDGTDYEKLYMNADMALNHARCESPDSYQIYNG